MRHLFLQFILFCSLCISCLPGIAATPRSTDNFLEKISLQFKWRHQFQFAGYYAAKEKGFYAEEGLDVTFKELTPEKNHIEAVLDGDADYGTADAGLLLHKTKGKPVVLLAQIFQHSPLIFISKKESGIISPYEMVGKRVMSQSVGSNAPLVGMLIDTLGDLSKVQQIPHSMNFDDLVDGRVDVISAYITDQPYTLKQQGVAINIINPQNYGIDYYGDNLFTTNKELRDHPERVEKMISASLKGWQYALAHKSEIIDIILEKYNPQLSRKQLEFEAKMTEMMILPDLVSLGEVDPKRFDKIAENYARLKLTNQKKVVDGFIYRGKQKSLFSLDSAERAWLQLHPKIRLGFPGYQEPILFIGEDGKETGFIVDFINEMNRRLGTNITVSTDSFDVLVEQIGQKNLDGIVAMYSDQETQLNLLPTKTNFEFYPVIYTRAETAQAFQNLDNIAGKSIAVQVADTFTHEILATYKDTITIIRVASVQEGLKLVFEKNVDAFLGLNVDAYFISTRILYGVVPAKVMLDKPTPTFMGIRSDWPELVSILNKGVNSFSQQEWVSFVSKWIPLQALQSTFYPDGEIEKVVLTNTEKKWLEEHPVIQVASDSAWAPMEFVDKDGNYKGIAIDYLRIIEKKLGIRFEIVKDQPWHQLLDQTKKRAIDMFTCVAPTTERGNYLSFTSPYITSPVVIFSRTEVPFIGNIAGLKGKKVAVVKGYAMDEILSRDHPEITLISVPDIQTALEMLESGNVFAYVGNLIVTSHHISQKGNYLVKVAGETPYELSLGMACRNDWPVFANILQKGLDSINTEERNRIYRNWISITYEHGFDYSLIWKIVGGGVLILSMFVFLNRRLKYEVEKQTAALKLSEEQYKLLADNAADVIWTMDTSEKMTYISPAVKELRGVTPEEAMAESLPEKFTPVSLKKVREIFAKKGQLDTPAIFEAKQPCIDGSTVWVEINVRNFIDESGNRIGLIGTSRNITERKQAEEEKKELEKQLQQTQKMESIGTLAGGIAHDFNNILSAIFGYAELVMANLPPESDNYEMQEQVVQAANRAKDLVKQILLFSRQADQEIRPVQPHLIIKEALKLVRSSIPSTIEIKQNVPVDCGSILADPTQIHQIIMNLCTNAYHAIPGVGGVLAVSLSKTEITKEDISSTNLELDPGQYFKLEVADTGHGIDHQTIEKIFNPYFTTKPKGKGTGLGLSVVHGIVKTCGGQIKVYSEPGQGTNIHIYFPIYESEGDTIAVQTESYLPTGKETILVVDDEKQILNMMKKTLESLGYKVVAHADSQESLKSFKADANNFDLVITDMTMPHMTGLQLTEQLFAIRPKMPIMLCSGFSELISEEKALALGIRKFLTKPIIRTQLAKAIREVLDDK